MSGWLGQDCVGLRFLGYRTFWMKPCSAMVFGMLCAVHRWRVLSYVACLLVMYLAKCWAEQVGRSCIKTLTHLQPTAAAPTAPLLFACLEGLCKTVVQRWTAIQHPLASLLEHMSWIAWNTKIWPHSSWKGHKQP